MNCPICESNGKDVELEYSTRIALRDDDPQDSDGVLDCPECGYRDADLERADTPEWYVDVERVNDGPSHIEIATQDGETLAVMQPVSDEFAACQEERAKLMAAAPKLLDELKFCQRNCDCDGQCRPCLLIATLEGRSMPVAV